MISFPWGPIFHFLQFFSNKQNLSFGFGKTFNDVPTKNNIKSVFFFLQVLWIYTVETKVPVEFFLRRCNFEMRSWAYSDLYGFFGNLATFYLHIMFTTSLRLPIFSNVGNHPNNMIILGLAYDMAGKQKNWGTIRIFCKMGFSSFNSTFTNLKLLYQLIFDKLCIFRIF